MFRCRDLAGELAAEAGLSVSEVGEVVWSAMLHDIGKLYIPDRVLLKPGVLDEEEWRLMRMHPIRGAELLEHGQSLAAARNIARWHHENLDGSGYPDGLRGSAIPLEARIVRMVDAWDAMTNDRPYRAAMSAERALEELRRYSGSAFDPELVELFTRLALDCLCSCRGDRPRLPQVLADATRILADRGGSGKLSWLPPPVARRRARAPRGHRLGQKRCGSAIAERGNDVGQLLGQRIRHRPTIGAEDPGRCEHSRRRGGSAGHLPQVLADARVAAWAVPLAWMATTPSRAYAASPHRAPPRGASGRDAQARAVTRARLMRPSRGPHEDDVQGVGSRGGFSARNCSIVRESKPSQTMKKT